MRIGIGIGIGAVAGVGVLAFAAAGAPDVAEVGRPVPAYSAERLDGGQVALEELRGEVVLLNVWATWCFPCRREMPGIEALHRELAAEGLRVVATSIDPEGTGQEIRDFVDELGLTFTILHDPEQRVARVFGTRGVPETYLIGRDGRLLRRWIGRIDARSESIRGAVRAAL